MTGGRTTGLGGYEPAAWCGTPPVGREVAADGTGGPIGRGHPVVGERPAGTPAAVPAGHR